MNMNMHKHKAKVLVNKYSVIIIMHTNVLKFIEKCKMSIIKRFDSSYTQGK